MHLISSLTVEDPLRGHGSESFVLRRIQDRIRRVKPMDDWAIFEIGGDRSVLRGEDGGRFEGVEGLTEEG
jgi:hypothetical protein